MRELIDILPKAYRRRGLWIACTLLLRAVLNLAGLAMLLPVLALVLDPTQLSGEGLLARAYALSGLASTRQFALVVCVGVVVVMLIKCLLNYGLARAEHKYIYELYRTLSRRLLTTYHDRGLPYIKSANSTVLGRNVNVVCLSFTAGVLKPVAAIAADALLLLLLIAALALYAPLAAALAVGVFVPTVWLYYRLVRNRINRFGEQENKAQREKARLVSETFRGYADIEINGAFPLMLKSFDRVMNNIVQIRIHEAALGQLPQALIEVGLAAGMALLAALSIGAGDMRLLFGVFAVAALRIMPSVRNILSSWATIRYNRYTIDILREAASDASLNTPATQADPSQLPFTRQIDVRDLGFRFADDGHELFRDFSLQIRKGEHIGIRGASGAGKTTLFNLLLGLYEPTSGTIEIDGAPLTPANRRAWQRHVGYVSQHLFIADGSFAANVALGVPDEQIDRQRVAEALHTARMSEFIDTLPQGIDTPVGECGCRLSGGQRQRIGIARALYRRAEVLFFDEATSALDNQTEEQVNRSIARLAAQQPGLTLIVIAHRESSLEYCDRIITLDKQ